MFKNKIGHLLKSSKLMISDEGFLFFGNQYNIAPFYHVSRYVWKCTIAVYGGK